MPDEEESSEAQIKKRLAIIDQHLRVINALGSSHFLVVPIIPASEAHLEDPGVELGVMTNFEVPDSAEKIAGLALMGLHAVYSSLNEEDSVLFAAQIAERVSVLFGDAIKKGMAIVSLRDSITTTSKIIQA